VENRTAMDVITHHICSRVLSQEPAPHV